MKKVYKEKAEKIHFNNLEELEKYIISSLKELYNAKVKNNIIEFNPFNKYEISFKEIDD